MKKLNSKAFWLIISGLVVGYIFSIINLLSTDYEKMFEGTGMSVPENYGTTVAITGAIIGAAIYAYFFYRLIKNLKEPAKQGYITFLFVIFIIGIALNVLTLITAFNWLVLPSIASQAAIIAGTAMQKKEPFVTMQY